MKKEIKILHISDTHGFHHDMPLVEDIDIIIHTGDETSSARPIVNEIELMNFIKWYEQVNAKHKILIAGNHSAALYNKLVTKETLAKHGIHYLENEGLELLGLNIWGSPWVPTFGNWYFMKDRVKLDKIWQHIPSNTDILLTHGPPKGILDISTTRQGNIEYCGDSALRKRIFKLKLKANLFGHIHDSKNNFNAGVTQLVGLDTIFSNGACVTDRHFDRGLTSFGNLITIKDESIITNSNWNI